MTTTGIDKNVETGLAKLKTAQNHNTRVIKNALENLRREIKNSGLTGQVSTAKDSHSSITQQLKLYHAHISKYTKVLDKVSSEYPVEINAVVVPEGEDPYLDLIGEYLCRTARSSTIESLTSSGHYQMSVQEEQYLQSVHHALTSLRQGDVSLAEDWTCDFLHTLQAQGQPTHEADGLTFDLVVVRFLQHLMTGNAEDLATALELSQAVFPVFMAMDEDPATRESGYEPTGQSSSRQKDSPSGRRTYQEDIGQLMSCLLFASSFGDSAESSYCCSATSPNKPSSSASASQSHSQSQLGGAPTPPVTSKGPGGKSPWDLFYPHLSVEAAIDTACEHLIAAAVKRHGLSPLNHLHTALRCGIEMMPSLRKGANLLAFTQSADQLPKSHRCWSDFGSIMMEYPEDKNLSFHSVFSCPVSREIASPGNNPVLLSCGHVILKSSLRALPKRASRFKCPTCYHEQTGEGMELFF